MAYLKTAAGRKMCLRQHYRELHVQPPKPYLIGLNAYFTSLAQQIYTDIKGFTALSKGKWLGQQQIIWNILSQS